MAMGFWTSGSAAKTVTRNPSGTRKPAAAAAGDIGPPAAGSVFRGRGKSSTAAAAGAMVANASTTKYEKAVRCILCPGASQVGDRGGTTFSSLLDDLSAV